MSLPKDEPISFEEEENRMPVRSITVALILTGIGIVLLISAIGVGIHHPREALYIVIVGSICIVPGLWALLMIYRARSGRRGYRVDQVNLFDK
mmetsp:Transcript_40345/g.160267  ORF Transcript_40345/g.160267 Transcript_40345/m.160267 type:complete len:93 (-) Transcript_40345:89-367(-)